MSNVDALRRLAVAEVRALRDERLGCGLHLRGVGQPVVADEVRRVGSREAKAVNRTHFNGYTWKKALVAAGVEPTRHDGCHARRHFYASALLE